MADVVLDIADFRERFPQFDDETKITDAVIQTQWYAVAALCGVTDAESAFPYMPDAEPPVYTRKIALYFALCHLLTIQGWGAGQTGPITNASQGSVSTAFQLMQGKTTTESFWLQTSCGARYWMMLKPYIMRGRAYISRGFHPWA